MIDTFNGKLLKDLSLDGNRDVTSALRVLRTIIRSCKGRLLGMRSVRESVFQLTRMKDVRVKKLVYLYLSFAVEEDPDIWLLITNSILNDSQDPNPSIRLSALRTLTDSHSVSSSIDNIRISQVEKSLEDGNPSVRKLAITGIVNLLFLFRKYKLEYQEMNGLFEAAKRLLHSDPDPSVVITCIRSLQNYEKNDLSMEIMITLLKNSSQVEPWQRNEIVELVQNFTNPEQMSHEDIFQILNLVDPFLDQQSTTYTLVLSTIAMLNVSKKFPKITLDIEQRSVDLLLQEITFCDSSVHCLIFPLLASICHQKTVVKFRPRVEIFYLLPSDTSFVKLHKLSILGKLCCEDNSLVIFRQVISSILTSEEKLLIGHSVVILFHVYQYQPDLCQQFIKDILKHENSVIVDAAILLLKQIKLSPQKAHKCSINLFDLSPSELFNTYNGLLSYESKSIYLWLLSLSDSLSSSSDQQKLTLYRLLKSIEDRWTECKQVLFKSVVLTTAMRLFFCVPALFRKLLGKLLQKALTDNSLVVKRKSYIYYNLLKHDIKSAMMVVGQSADEFLHDAGDHVEISVSYNLCSLMMK